MTSMTPQSVAKAIRVYSRTDVGKRRQRNEDFLGVIARHGIYIVADGMGGVDGGDYCSKRVVEDLISTFEHIDPESCSFWERLDLVSESVNASSAGIQEEALSREISGMGTTFVALCIDLDEPTRGCALHVGDSRVYRFRNRKLTAITKDHSLVAESGLEDSAAVPLFMAGVITRAVGVKDAVEVERTPLDIQPGDSFMLCSDGLYNMIPLPELTDVFRKKCGDPSVELIQSANDAGGFDNITVVILQIPSGSPVSGNLDDTIT